MLSKYPTIQDALERAERRAQELPHVAQVNESDWDVVVLANEVKRLKRELQRFTPKKEDQKIFPQTIPITPHSIPWNSCNVCGMKFEGPMGYVCPRPDCPTAVTCVSVRDKYID